MLSWNGYEIPWKINGKKCYAKRMQKIDCENIVNWINDPQINYYLFYGWRPISFEEFWKEVELNKKTFNFSIFDKKTHKHIGWGGIHDVIWSPISHGEIRLFIGDTSFWGKGNATEMEKMMMIYSFDVLNIDRLTTGVNEKNKNVVKLVKSCKYVKEGILRNAIFRNNLYYDAHLYSISRNEFEKHRKFIEEGIEY